MKYKISGSILLLLLFFSQTGYGQVKLPQLISDGMVLQRDSELKIWGWAPEGEKLSIEFNGNTYKATADKDGKWMVKLPPMEAGGPYDMNIEASNKITVKDILIGDVWVASGQSNMETTMERVKPLYEDVIKSVDYPQIRYFNVADLYNFKSPQTDLGPGNWIPADTANILNYSAVAFFFARELHEKYDVPIGVINASVGGSPVEAWLSKDALKNFPVHFEEAKKFSEDAYIKKIETDDQDRSNKWYQEVREKDEGYKDLEKPWFSTSTDDAEWSKMEVPGFWEERVNGVVWFRKEIDVPASMVGKPAKLLLGRIIDSDSVYINGEFVGTTGYQYPPRRYEIDADVLKEGKNSIVVRIINNAGRGGFVTDKPYELSAGATSIDLKGEWKYKVGATMAPLAGPTFIRWKPMGLYNAMIAPLHEWNIKGVIWYQGESNTDNSEEYRELFTSLIKDWRNKWNQKTLPFLYVQLPNFMRTKEQPSDSDWAKLREAQRQTLAVPNTGMAVAIDLGEWNDIHPLNKEDVGKRLSLAAQKLAYGEEDIVFSGPIFQSMEISGKKAIISFAHTGSGLVAKDGGELKHFAIAGEDGKFVWAKAKIQGDKVVVWDDSVSKPVFVRYAWADNPERANLYNKEGLPASPFRTNK